MQSPSLEESFILRERQFTWRPLRVLIYYRIVIAVILTALAAFATIAPQHTGGTQTDASWVSLGYLVFAAIQILPFVKQWPGFRLQVHIQATGDIFFLGTLMYLLGSTGGGLGILLVVAITGASILSRPRIAVAYAALATIVVLLLQVYGFLKGVTFSYPALTQSGVLGGVLFIAALVGNGLAKQARDQARIAEKRGQDIENLEKINEFIVKHLPSGIIVVSPINVVVLSNSSAKLLLGLSGPQSQKHIDDLNPQLSEQLNAWRENPSLEPQSISVPDGSHNILLRFDALQDTTDGTIIVTIDDGDALSDKVQQAKLASLGRLTASIAHEVRNPLGAISHAGQLLSEATGLSDTDQRMTQIIQENCRRVNNIIESVLQLSRREKARGRDIELSEWIPEFINEFVSTHAMAGEQFALESTSDQLKVWIDPNHLHQILWNLCENSLKYGQPADGSTVHLKLFVSREKFNNQTFIDLMDNGPGIPADLSEAIFEPFYTTHTTGTGLGLYICKELAELNRCRLKTVASVIGARFRLSFTKPND